VATPPSEQIAQAQPQTATQPATTTASTASSANSTSLGTMLRQNWLIVLIGALVLLSLVMIVAMRSRAQRGSAATAAVATPVRRASRKERRAAKKEAAELEDADKALPVADVLYKSSTLPKAKPLATEAATAIVAAGAAEALEEETKAASVLEEDETKEVAIAPLVDTERVDSEVRNVLAGESYDETIVGATDADTRQLIATELLSALAGRNVERRERAREAFIKHDYLDEATRRLRTADAPAERAAAARSLGYVQDKSTTPHLVAALDDQEPEVRRAAVESLAELRDPSALQPLKDLLTRERDRKVSRSLIKRAIQASRAIAEEPTASTSAVAPAPETETVTLEAEAPAVETAEQPTALADLSAAEVAPALVGVAASSLVTEEVDTEAEEAARREAEAEEARQRAEEERMRVEEEERLRVEAEAQRQAEEEARVAAEAKAEEERKQAEEAVRLQAEEEERARAAEEERLRLEAEARQREEEEAARLRAAEEERQRIEEERKLAEEEARQQAEAAARARAEEEAARQRAEEAARLKAEAEAARRQAEEEAARRAEAERVRLAEEARLRAEAEAAQQRAEEEARQREEEESRRLAAAEAQRKAEEEARLTAEAEARARAEEEETARRRLAEEEAAAMLNAEAISPVEHEAVEETLTAEASTLVQPEPFIERNDATASGWVDVDISHQEILSHPEPPPVTPTEETATQESLAFEPVAETVEARAPETKEIEPAGFSIIGEPSSAHPVSKEIDYAVTERGIAEFDEFSSVPGGILKRLSSEEPAERAAAVADLARVGGDDSFREISAAFDDPSVEVRNAAARSLFNLNADRAATFTKALRESPPERRRKIGSALASSGLASEAIGQLMGESREKTYDAFSLLFLMSKAGEVQPLMRAVEEHPNNEVRLAVVKLLALSGQQEILPAFRRLAVRGSLPTEVRSAVMEAIYQISSQTPGASA
jgi:hypothetical protein